MYELTFLSLSFFLSLVGLVSLSFLCLLIACLYLSSLSLSGPLGHHLETQVFFFHYQALLTPHTGPWIIQVLNEHLSKSRYE